AGAETVAASALRRAAVTGEKEAVARVGDLPGIVPTLRGKVEFEASEEGREIEVLRHLLRRAVAETFRLRLAGTDLSGLVSRFEEGETVETGELVPAEELLRRVGPVEGLRRQARRQARELRERSRLDGTLEDVRALLDKAVGEERAELFPDPSDDARLRETRLDSLPSEASRAVRELADYDWRSPQARATFEQLQDLLRREVLDRQFRGLKPAVE